MYLTVKRKI